MSVFFELYAARDTFIYDLDFWRFTLLNMQKDQTNTESECVETFDTFITLYETIAAGAIDDASYVAGLAAKGAGEGTDYGFLIQKGQNYIDVGIYGVNVYNYCDLSYYLKATSKAVGSVSGAMNQLVNLGYRFFSQEDAYIYYDLSVAIYDDDIEGAGAAFGTFISRFLMVDVPEFTTTPAYKKVSQLM